LKVIGAVSTSRQLLTSARGLEVIGAVSTSRQLLASARGLEVIGAAFYQPRDPFLR
jgi:hypothetical protein